MSVSLWNKYVIKNVMAVTAVVSVILAVIILLTQSLRFLELIMNAGASTSVFWRMAFLALPRFFEIIVPVSLMIGGLAVYSRMMGDRELIVMRSAGVSPLQMLVPAIKVGITLSVFMVFLSFWLAPISLTKMQEHRQVLKTQYSTLLFQEGVFNKAGNGLMIYVDKRNSQGQLEGIVMYDSRDTDVAPSTIFAKRGVVVATAQGQQVLVYEGSRQEFNKTTGVLSRLDFSRYSIDLPDPEAVRQRWKEPDERTFFELLKPDMTNPNDVKYRRDFLVEAHSRIAGIFLPITYSVVSLSFLLLGSFSRRRQNKKIVMAVVSVIVLQSAMLSFNSMSSESMVSVVLLYMTSFIPSGIVFFLLSSTGERLLHLYSFSKKGKTSFEKESIVGDTR